MHPADELHHVRAQIRALKAREGELRAGLITGMDRIGATWIAEIGERRARRLDAARLPLSLRADPRMYLERASLAVTLRLRTDLSGPPAPVRPLSPPARFARPPRIAAAPGV